MGRVPARRRERTSRDSTDGLATPVPVLLPHTRGSAARRCGSSAPGCPSLPRCDTRAFPARPASSRFSTSSATGQCPAGWRDGRHGARGRCRRPRPSREMATARSRLPATTTYALGRACAECRSPRESDMLQVWESVAGFPRPLMNREVRDLSGRLLAVVDLLEVEAGICGEYNGAAHRSRERQCRDEERPMRCAGWGWRPSSWSGATRTSCGSADARCAGRALWLPPAERRWHVGAFVPAPPRTTRTRPRWSDHARALPVVGVSWGTRCSPERRTPASRSPPRDGRQSAPAAPVGPGGRAFTRIDLAHPRLSPGAPRGSLRRRCHAQARDPRPAGQGGARLPPAPRLRRRERRTPGQAVPDRARRRSRATPSSRRSARWPRSCSPTR